MREREQLFNEFMTDFRKHEKEKLKLREEKVYTQFSTRVVRPVESCDHLMC